MGKAKPGDGFCPQCKRSGLLVRTCRATQQDYCDDWSCMKAAGVPSVVNPSKRAKKEEEPRPPMELGAAAAANMAGAAAAGAADIDAADEDAALRAEQASLAALMEQLAGALCHAKARHEHIARLLAARRETSAAAEAVSMRQAMEAIASVATAAPVPFVTPEDAPPSVARQHAAWDAHRARGGSSLSTSRQVIFTSNAASAAPAAAAVEIPAAAPPASAVESAPPAVENAPAQAPVAACEVDAAPAPAPACGRRRVRHDTVTIEDLGPDGASPASSASGTPRARAGLRSGGRM